MATPRIINAPSCVTCRFAIPDGASLQCQYGPPTANAIFAPDGKGGVKLAGVVSVFPVMNADQRCGRHERALAIRIDDAKLASAFDHARVP